MIKFLIPLAAFALFANSAMAQEDNSNDTNTVTVGAYVNDIQALDLRQHSYAMDLYIWFRWKGSEFDPAKTVEVINSNETWGQVKEPQYEEIVELPGGEKYQVMRIQGRFSHKFSFENYPYDRQVLWAELEDSIREINQLKFVQDDKPVAIHPKLILPGFRIGEPKLTIEDFQYPTSFGDTRQKKPDSYSRVRIEIPIRRPVFTSSLKMLLPVLCVVFGASLMLRFKVTLIDARLGIGITSLLTVVAIQMAANDTMPSVDYLVLMDKIHLTAYAYVLFGLVVVLATSRRVDADNISGAQKLQSSSFWVSTLIFLLTISLLVGNAILEG